MSKFIELTYLNGSKCFVKGISSVREERDYRLVTLQCGGSIDVINTVEEVAQKAREYEDMLLRDEFAKAALTGLLASGEKVRSQDTGMYSRHAVGIAYKAGAYADAMLNERLKER